MYSTRRNKLDSFLGISLLFVTSGQQSLGSTSTVRATVIWLLQTAQNSKGMYDVAVGRNDITSTRRFAKISHVCSNTTWLICAVISYDLIRACRSCLLSCELRVREHLKEKTSEHDDMQKVQAENYCWRKFMCTHNWLLTYDPNCGRTDFSRQVATLQELRSRTDYLLFAWLPFPYTYRHPKKTPGEQRAFS